MDIASSLEQTCKRKSKWESSNGDFWARVGQPLGAVNPYQWPRQFILVQGRVSQRWQMLLKTCPQDLVEHGHPLDGHTPTWGYEKKSRLMPRG